MEFQLYLLFILNFCFCACLNPPQTGDPCANLTARLNALEQKVNSLTNNRKVYFTYKVVTSLHNLGKHQVIHFGKMITQEGDAYDSTTGIFTAPLAGTYLFIANLMNNPQESRSLEAFIVKNGQQLVRIPCNDQHEYTSCSGTLNIHLAIGERIWIEHNLGGTVDDASYFSGIIISVG